jgi:hypothetical protein
MLVDFVIFGKELYIYILKAEIQVHVISFRLRDQIENYELNCTIGTTCH